MATLTHTIRLAPMALADIPQVVAIDQRSFSLPWSASSYRFELTENHASHFYVALPEGLPPVRSFLQRLRHLGQRPPRLVVGYIGYWLIEDEIHISTIAVHPDWRGQGIGDQLLEVALRQAAEAAAVMVTLEVRTSNTVAQNLYRKYAFEVVGRRKRYYRDNHEDALIMTVELDADRRARILAQGHP
jgi:[ribosomal protein S18]-alanine N-acetyltransferase